MIGPIPLGAFGCSRPSRSRCSGRVRLTLRGECGGIGRELRGEALRLRKHELTVSQVSRLRSTAQPQGVQIGRAVGVPTAEARAIKNFSGCRSEACPAHSLRIRGVPTQIFDRNRRLIDRFPGHGCEQPGSWALLFWAMHAQFFE